MVLELSPHVMHIYQALGDGEFSGLEISFKDIPGLIIV